MAWDVDERNEEILKDIMKQKDDPFFKAVNNMSDLFKTDNSQKLKVPSTIKAREISKKAETLIIALLDGYNLHMKDWKKYTSAYYALTNYIAELEEEF